jgi:hypothetical protein
MPPILLASIALLLLSVGAANAQILLTIEYTSPSAVTITATGAAPGATATSTLDQGIDLTGFFLSNPTFTQNNAIPSSSLTTGNGSGGVLTFNQWATDEYSNQSFDNDLNLYGSSASETFSLDSAAFAGTLTLDLSSLASYLPTVGASGTLVTGYYTAPGGNTPIGSWQVVSAPEPSTWFLAALGVASVALFRAGSTALRNGRNTVGWRD